MRGAWVLVVMVVGLGACGEDKPLDGTSDVAETTVDTLLDTTVETVEPTDTAVADSDTADTSVETEVVATTCSGPDDCVLCAYPTKVAKPDECYCVFCPSTPMTMAQCADNQASWTAHCNPWPGPGICPSASCIFGAPPLCDPSGQCVADPNSCAFPEQCGSCRFGGPPPVTAEDCRCPMCPQPLAIAYCEQIEAAVADVCAGFDFGACLPPPCMRPPPITCGESLTCGYDTTFER